LIAVLDDFVEKTKYSAKPFSCLILIFFIAEDATNDIEN